MAFFGRVISAADAQSVWSYCAEHLRPSQSTRFGVIQSAAKERSDLAAHPDEQWKQVAALWGMPIEFDAARRERTPWVTWLLCLLIISASTFGFTQLHEIVSRLGLIPTQAMRDGGVTFLTSFFLHAGVLHLVGNIYFLFVFGDDVENFLRPFPYLALRSEEHTS